MKTHFAVEVDVLVEVELLLLVVVLVLLATSEKANMETVTLSSKTSPHENKTEGNTKKTKKNPKLVDPSTYSIELRLETPSIS